MLGLLTRAWYGADRNGSPEVAVRRERPTDHLNHLLGLSLSLSLSLSLCVRVRVRVSLSLSLSFSVCVCGG